MVINPKKKLLLPFVVGQAIIWHRLTGLKGNTIGKKHSSELARTGHYRCHFVGTKSNRWVTRPFVGLGLQSLSYSLNVKQNATMNHNLPQSITNVTLVYLLWHAEHYV